MSDLALELQNIRKQFPGIVASDDVHLRVRRGSIHALVGENGAGKTTLMRIAYGELRPDRGSVRIGGAELGAGGPKRAIALGLGMVHQHFMLVPTLPVLENVVLGCEPRRGFWLDRDAARRRLETTAARFALRVNPEALVQDLGVGEQQRVEILKVLLRGARVLILDEPTAVLAPGEVEDLFSILRRLAAEGHAVVLISHRLQEVLSLADTITVLRDGRVVDTVEAERADVEQLARLIVGRPLPPPPPRRVETAPAAESAAAVPLLQCDSVCTGERREALHDVSLQVCPGEILGVAGVDGNGQRTLAQALLGLEGLARGRIVLDGEDVSHMGSADRRQRGMAAVPADRLREGLVVELRIDENAILGRQREAHLGRGPWLLRQRMTAFATGLLQRFDVRPNRPDAPAAVLSGGNQQRLVMGRELDRDPKLLILSQPTRGVDVGGIAFLHERILEARDAGKGILLISADLNEILALSDRIVVFYEGRVAGSCSAADADPMRLGLWMTGAPEGTG